MNILQLQPKTTSKTELRKFGIIFGIFLVSIFGLLLPWIFEHKIPTWPWMVFIVIELVAITCPLKLDNFFRVWMLFGNIIGWLNTRIILGIVFYLVFLPVGLLFKLLGKDLLSRKIDTKLETYKIMNMNTNKNNMENPF